MRDLELFRVLQNRYLPAEAVREPLQQLAQLSFEERIPFFGLMERPLGHEDPLIRAAAVRVLRGTFGVQALRQIHQALIDDVPEVRLAALDALRESCEDDPLRWVHALFHRDPQVRRAAIDPAKPLPPAEWYLLYLFPDPELAAEAKARLQGKHIPADGLAPLFDYATRGLLTVTEFLQYIEHADWSDLLHFASRWAERSPETVARFFELLNQSEGIDRADLSFDRDGFDDLFAFALRAEADEQARFFGRVLKKLASASKEIQERAVASLLIAADRLGVLRSEPSEPEIVGSYAYQPLGDVASVSWIALAVAFRPSILKSPHLPLLLRRSGLKGLYLLRERCPKQAEEVVKALVQGPICRGNDGVLDLWAVGAVLHFLTSGQYESLLKWVPIDEVVRGFRADFSKAVPFLRLPVPPRKHRGRRALLRAFCAAAGANTLEITARLAHVVPIDVLDEVLNGLDLPSALRLFDLLRGLSEGPTAASAMPGKKTAKVAEYLTKAFAGSGIAVFLDHWLKDSKPESSPLGLAVLTHLARGNDFESLRVYVERLSSIDAGRFLACVNACVGFPYEREVLLADMYILHPDEALRNGALRVLRHRSKQADPTVEAAGFVRRRGIAARLASEQGTASPDVETCVELLIAFDPPSAVAAQFARFSEPSAAFVNTLDARFTSRFRNEAELPLLGHLWLYRWEFHAEQAAILGAFRSFGMMRVLLAEVNEMHASPLTRRVWEAALTIARRWSVHAKADLAQLHDEELANLLAQTLTTPNAAPAADWLMWWRDQEPTHSRWERLRNFLLPRLTKIPDECRKTLHGWLDFRGVAVAAAAKSTAAPSPPLSEDADELLRLLDDPNCPEPLEVARQLALVLDSDDSTIADLLIRDPKSAQHTALVQVLREWPFGNGLLAVTRLLLDPNLPKERRREIGRAVANNPRQEEVRIALGKDDQAVFADADSAPALVARWGSAAFDAGCSAFAPRILRAFTEPEVDTELTPEQLRKLIAAHPDACGILPALVLAPTPSVFTVTVDYLIEKIAEIPNARSLLRSFLELGTERPHAVRQKAALALKDDPDFAALFPLALQRLPDDNTSPFDELLVGVDYRLVGIATDSLLAIGTDNADMEAVLFLEPTGVDTFARQDAATEILKHARCPNARAKAREIITTSYRRTAKLHQVADTFVWGVRMGRQLTGKRFSIEMLANEQLGYTRFSENKIFITPLPMLRGEMYGRAVVEALILHEYGHHMYHRAPKALEIWKQAEKEKLHGLLNLVADEHLERNLRALDRSFGDDLKLLGSYAFQHAARDVAVEKLLSALHGRAFEVLSGSDFETARAPGCVRIVNGWILQRMEQLGMSFARFVRALRMNLGNRFGDPKVQAGLDLFKGKFRRSSMERLYEITRKLREIFGWETELLESFSLDASLSATEEELEEAGEGITNEDVQTAVRDALNIDGKPRTSSHGGIGGRGLNLDKDEDFTLITQVQPMPFDPEKYAELAAKVARPARKMRAFFDSLGIKYSPQRLRLAGKFLDRSRIRSLVSRGDPRVMISRRPEADTDLFLGVVIDCSGSMSNGTRMPNARLFGALLAEAAKGHKGIDVRVIGFTDQVIYDCGTADRCAVHALSAGGGNNDAAALWHMAQRAKASRRKAKLLVMISDGSPTECTVTALSALVQRLTSRMKICCAQVAVCPIHQKCFPNYIQLDISDMDASVGNFGKIIAGLVKKVLRG